VLVGFSWLLFSLARFLRFCAINRRHRCEGWTTLTVLATARPRVTVEESPIEETGSWEFTSARDPSQVYRVTYGRAGHLECTCKGFEFRGNCKHVREVRVKVA
jgi:hypothetical protein